MNPTILLGEARGIIARADSALSDSWPEVASLLVRQALEEALDEFWLRGDEDIATLRDATMATQLACLPAFIDRDIAHQTSFVWSALSHACHYHSYDLPPSANELDDWISDVTRLVAETATAVPGWR